MSDPRPTANGRRLWRSLEERAGDPAVRTFLEREFPEGASEPPEGVSRRTVLSLLGASLSLAGFAGCRRPVEEIVPFVRPPEERVPGIPQRYATTMPFGLHAWGAVVESHEGRPTKIEGNELHPSTLGSSNAWMQAAILELYDPDRSQKILEGGEARNWADFVAAWAVLDARYRETNGAGLAVLASPFASPTLARLARRFRERFPAASWATYEPTGDENRVKGARLATGRALLPLHELDRARVILALDADLLGDDGESVRNARRFADGRRLVGGRDAMSRLYAVEAAYSLTGANADHRLPLAAGKIAGFVAALADRLADAGVAGVRPAGPAPVPDAEAGRWVEALAGELLAHRGAGVLVAGPRQPPQVHAAVHALNHALGNAGTTVSYHPLRDAEPSDVGGLVALAAALRGGEVSTLVILGGNPAYDAPADLGLAEALGAVETVLHIGPYRDETARLCGWHVPEAHWLESWSDARAVDGTASVVQPLIQPLYGAKSRVELLGLLAGGEEQPGYDLVRETWSAVLGSDGFEARWRRVLHDGLHAESAAPAEPPPAPRGPIEIAQAPAGEGLEIVFAGSSNVHDGRFANLGWLQEMPDPLTKLTWDNAALVSPATAARLGLADGALVRLRLGQREVVAPLRRMPGQADDTVVAALGYGRRAAGRIGDGVGFDAYALRASSAPGFAAGLAVEPAGGVHAFATTQQHGSMEGRPLIREASLAEYRHDPKFAREMVELPPEMRSMWREPSYEQGHQWGMSIDLNACTGCSACVVACQSENNIPVVGKDQVARGREMHWIRIDRYFAGDEAAPEARFQPVPCMHCENAPCEQVCPVAATVHDSEGLNVMVYNRCIGTRYCSNNCPYKVRRFNFYNFTGETPEAQKMANNPNVTVRSRGVMEKCTYCTQRIAAARIGAKLAGRELADGDVQTACQQACPTRAITFGDLRDPDSLVARRKREDREYSLLEELYTRPRTTYLAKVDNPADGMEPA